MQGSYWSWKTLKAVEFYNFIFQARKVMEFDCGSWKFMGMTKNDFSENNKPRSTLYE